MKVCFVLHSSGKGGAERANLELIDGLQDKGIKCYAILPTYGAMIRELEKREIPLKIIPYKRWMAATGLPFWKRIGRIVLNLIMIIPVVIQAKKWRVNIIYTNAITICVGAFVAKIISKSKFYNPYSVPRISAGNYFCSFTIKASGMFSDFNNILHF